MLSSLVPTSNLEAPLIHTATTFQASHPSPIMAPIRTTSDMDIDSSLPSDISDFNPSDYIQTAHNSRLYKENQNLKRMVRELVDYQNAHPKLIKPTTREEIDNEKKVALAIEIKKKYIRAQMAVMKTLYRQSVMKVREEKEQTAKSRSHNDGLILGLNNLKYEEQSLRSEISAAENHEYVPLNPCPCFCVILIFMLQSQIQETPPHPRRNLPRRVPRTLLRS